MSLQRSELWPRISILVHSARAFALRWSIMARTERVKGNNYIVVIFDSCRYDSMKAAKPKNIERLGEIEKRWSYASWTAPSHYNLLSGLLPHSNPTNVFASEYYKKDFHKYSERLGIE